MVLRYLLFICTFLIFAVLSLATTAAAEGMSWTSRQTIRGGTAAKSPSSDILHIKVTGQATELSSKNEVLFIDYKDMVLYRLHRPSGQCAVFDIQETETDRVSAQLILLLTESLVKESTESKEIGGVQCDKKTIVLGAGLFRFRTFAAKVVERYGDSFSEAVGEYWVCADDKVWPLLCKAVQQRQTAFAAFPILKRIDPLGLMDAIGGFPVQGWLKTGGTVIESELVDGPDAGVLPLRPPQECREGSVKRN